MWDVKEISYNVKIAETEGFTLTMWDVKQEILWGNSVENLVLP